MEVGRAERDCEFKMSRIRDNEIDLVIKVGGEESFSERRVFAEKDS